MTRYSSLTINASRETGIPADTLNGFADFSERRARELIASGMSETDALNIAADEALTVAREMGLF